MKVTLEFDAVEDAQAYLSGPDMSHALEEIYQSVRSYIKHADHEIATAMVLLERVKELSYRE